MWLFLIAQLSVILPSEADESFTKNLETVFEEISFHKKETPPSWTCPICGKTFEKPEVHKCKEIPSKPKK